MPDRRGSALPGAPPLPPGNPPSDLDIDYSSVEEIYCATKNIPLPDTMSDKDSDSDSSSDDRTSSSESEYDDSTSKKAQKSKGLKRKKPESSDESDMNTPSSVRKLARAGITPPRLPKGRARGYFFWILGLIGK